MSSNDTDTSLILTLSSELSIEVHDSLDVVLWELRMAILPGIKDVFLQKVLRNGVVIDSTHYISQQVSSA